MRPRCQGFQAKAKVKNEHDDVEAGGERLQALGRTRQKSAAGDPQGAAWERVQACNGLRKDPRKLHELGDTQPLWPEGKLRGFGQLLANARGSNPVARAHFPRACFPDQVRDCYAPRNDRGSGRRCVSICIIWCGMRLAALLGRNNGARRSLRLPTTW